MKAILVFRLLFKQMNKNRFLTYFNGYEENK